MCGFLLAQLGNGIYTSEAAPPGHLPAHLSVQRARCIGNRIST
jgi:hypothetical protein